MSNPILDMVRSAYAKQEAERIASILCPTRKPVKWCSCLECEIFAHLGYKRTFNSPVMDGSVDDYTCPWCGSDLESV